MSRLRERRNRHDHYYRQAKQENYAARSVYKLEQLDLRFQLFRQGQRVLDLGCRPGSWIQYIGPKVGPQGRIVGLDRRPLEFDPGPTCRIVSGDVFAISAAELRGDLPCFHVVLSDMAPDTSGVSFTDQVRSVELAMRAFELSLELGCPSSHFVAKVLMGEGFQEALGRIKQAYQRVKVVRPPATRRESTEVYVVAQQRR